MKGRMIKAAGAIAKVTTETGNFIWFSGVDQSVLSQLIKDFGRENVTITDWGEFTPGTKEYKFMKDMLVL
jgi:hypothetical protein